MLGAFMLGALNGFDTLELVDDLDEMLVLSLGACSGSGLGGSKFYI
jgi:hypothetical protein